MLNFALMGCGRIAKRHSELLGQGEIPGARLSAVCDQDLSKAKALGQRFSVPYYGAISDLLEKEKIDVVTILTESGSHAKHVIEVAAFGKHIMVEKPMALKLADADRMISACETAGVSMFVVKQNRYNLPVVKLKQAVQQGRFGKMVLGTVRVRWCRRQSYYDQGDWRGSWEMDGGVAANQASHHIDLLIWIMGEVESVFAKSSTRLVDIQAEDTIVATVKFKSGALGIIEATTATRPNDLEGSISVLGETGSVVIGGFSVNKINNWSFEKKMEGDNEVLRKFSENPPDVYGFGHRAFYNGVVKSLRDNSASSVNGEEGKKSLKLLHAIYQSVETGKEIFLEDSDGSEKLGCSVNVT
ncbi:Gfo/Idh/MocA family protein [Pseudopelagicola sp. nBUS_20]|uniref:Gfo/Idh/MocA family protein n=1 Tax=Pseudopelagicola sp. nBUS_20 TaxID=3395317 RepID=UPI003EB8CF67